MQINNLFYKHHKDADYFFENLSFHLEAGKINALHGKNGLGKSVLLNIISGNTPKQAVIKGEIVNATNAVLVNQRFDQMIADKFSFEDNLRFACMQRYPSPFTGLKQPNTFSEVLDRFNIDKTKPAYNLSGGQRQILALLMVLQKPMDLLLLDEPTATLDEQNAQLVFEFLSSIAVQNVTLFIVCHDFALIDKFTNGQKLFLEMDDLTGTRRMRF